MKNKSVLVLAIGLIVGYSYKEYSDTSQQMQVYSSRDIQSDLKKEVERVNTILDQTEKKYIKTNVPKPSPPSPEIACKCNGDQVIVQPDGNKSQCQCFKDGGVCKCKPKQQDNALLQQSQVQNIQVNP